MRIRPTARVMVFDTADRILLLEIHDKLALHVLHPGMTQYWLVPGGGLDPGETPEQAAVRELREETSLQIASPGPCLWVEDRPLVPLPVDGAMTCRDHYFAVRISQPEVHLGNLLDYEKETHLAFKWWDLTTLERSGDDCVPHDLVARARAWLANNPQQQG